MIDPKIQKTLQDITRCIKAGVRPSGMSQDLFEKFQRLTPREDPPELDNVIYLSLPDRTE